MLQPARRGVEMPDPCELKATLGVHAPCDEERCVYWRAVQHLDISTRESGCAIQHFEMLGGRGSDIAAWLLSVKERVESAGEGCSGLSA